MTDRAKILEMVEKGIITASEAEELLDFLENDDKEYDKDSFEKIKMIWRKIEEWFKKTSDNVKNSDSYKELKEDLGEFKDRVKEVYKKVETKLDSIYNKSIKENISDIGESFKRFGRKVASIFKTKEAEDDINEEDYIELIEEEKNKEDL